MTVCVRVRYAAIEHKILTESKDFSEEGYECLGIFNKHKGSYCNDQQPKSTPTDFKRRGVGLIFHKVNRTDG